MPRSAQLLALAALAGGAYAAPQMAMGQGLSWCPADSKTPCGRIIGANPVRIRMTHVQSAYSDGYEDDGAVCWDPDEGDISLNVIVQGDIVRLDRPGVYKIMYTCANDKGVEAPPLIRYVRVSEQWDPGCDSVTLGGRSKDLRHYDRMGEYALQYERCEGSEVVGQQTADGPAGRCVQTTIDGYPVYKQVKGDNWMYYYEPSRMWVVDTQFTCAIKCTPLFDIKGAGHQGLRVVSDAHKPEDINDAAQLAAGRKRHNWQMAKLDGRWEEVASVSASCTAAGQGTSQELAMPPQDHQVEAEVTLTEVVLPFNDEDRKEFVLSVADVLDVAKTAVHIGSIKQPLEQYAGAGFGTGGRRLRRADAAAEANTGQVTIDFTVVESADDLEQAVVPTLKETMFSDILRTELRQQGLKVGSINVEKVGEPSLTTHAFLVDLLVYSAAGCGVIGAAIVAFTLFDLKQKSAAAIATAGIEIQDQQDAKKITGDDLGGGNDYGATTGEEESGLIT